MPSKSVQRGLYLGDVTALCTLEHSSTPTQPRNTSTCGENDFQEKDRRGHTLLAGIGGSVRWYDPFRSGQETLLLVSSVFDSGRIHGIVPAPPFDKSYPVTHFHIGHKVSRPSFIRALVIWGERRVILAAIQCDDLNFVKARLVRSVAVLPLLAHWVHDVIPLSHDTVNYGQPTVAVGLADNSVEQWNMPTRATVKVGVTIEPTCIRRIECAMRSVLYSLALYGSSMDDLKVAGGTIFNEIQLWAPSDARNIGMHVERACLARERPKPWAALSGHEGSILRVRWASDGGHVFSTSDDRTARIWRVPSRHERDLDSNGTTPGINKKLGGVVTLYGHSSRVWDLHVTSLSKKTLVVTAGEDCTVRLWNAPSFSSLGKICKGKGDDLDLVDDLFVDEPLAILRGHRGRGVWRAMTMLSPSGEKLLVTAGADASIKLWDIQQYIRSRPERNEQIREAYIAHQQDDESVNVLPATLRARALPDQNTDSESDLHAGRKCWADVNNYEINHYTSTLKDHLGNSKGEYIRVICLSDHLTLYVATNRGRLYMVNVTKAAKNVWHWREIHRVNHRGPVIGLIRVTYFGDISAPGLNEHDLVLGDMHGMISTMKISWNNDDNDDKLVSHKSSGFATQIQQSWQACEPRRLLDVFSGTDNTSEMTEHLFTSEVGGIVKCWKRMSTASFTGAECQATWSMLGIAQMPFKQRVLALSYHCDKRLLLCGDQSGNVAVFDVNVLSGYPHFHHGTIKSPFGLLAVSQRAHGKNAITLVAIRNVRNNQPNFFSNSEHQIPVEFLTAGRDGWLRTFTLRPISELVQSHDDQTNIYDEQPMLSMPMTKRWHAKSRKQLISDTHSSLCLAMGAPNSNVNSPAPLAPYYFICLTKQRVPEISTMHALRWGKDHWLQKAKRWPVGNAKTDSLCIVAGFKETEFVAINMFSHRELLRVQCGGWHRPLSLLIDGDNLAEISFAFVKGDELSLFHSLPRTFGIKPTDGEWSLCELNGWSHGREIHAVRILPPPDVCSEHFGLLTGSEDGSIICHHHTRTSSGQMMHREEEIGVHIGGSAVRAIALFPEFPGGGLVDIVHNTRSYILLSAGAKEVIMAWRIVWIRADECELHFSEAAQYDTWDIRTTLLGAREQTKESKTSNQRCMAVVGFVPLQCRSHHCALHSVGLSATSDGSLKVLALHSDGSCGNFGVHFKLVTTMHHSSHALISLAVVAMTLNGAATFAMDVVVLACTGATDGTIAIWDLTSIIHSLSTQPSRSGNELKNFHNTGKPVVSLPCFHQSGVNSLAMTTSTNGTPGRVFIASGGDDQVIRVTLILINQRNTLEKNNSNFISVDVLQTVHTDFAHGSSIKGVWMDNSGTLATTSHDQRLRVWKVREAANQDLAIAAVAGSFVECPEPETLDACFLGGNVNILYIAVAGRGLQMFCVDQGSLRS